MYTIKSTYYTYRECLTSHTCTSTEWAVTKTRTGLGLDWDCTRASSPMKVSLIRYMIFNRQCTYHVISLVWLALFSRLFRALLMLVLDMMDDNDVIVMESPGEMAHITTINTVTAPVNDITDTLIDKLLPVN